MDPVSIIAAIGSTSRVLYRVSTTLYTFITRAKVVDKSLDALHDEIRGLHAVLKMVKKTIAALHDFPDSTSRIHSMLPKYDSLP